MLFGIFQVALHPRGGIHLSIFNQPEVWQRYPK